MVCLVTLFDHMPWTAWIGRRGCRCGERVVDRCLGSQDTNHLDHYIAILSINLTRLVQAVLV